MRWLFLYAVVEEVLNFPFWVRCAVQALGVAKTPSLDGFSCNITWGYVTWIGDRAGFQFEGYGGGSARARKNMIRLCKIVPKVS